MTADQRLCACDELKMATTRLRLMTHEEILIGDEPQGTLHPYEVGALLDV